MKIINKNQLILASKSPRRKELLARAGISFSVVPGMFDESSISPSSPRAYVELLAEAKAKEISLLHPDNWVLGADTIVLINDEILEKPKSESEAFKMLKLLSGNVHEVLTGYFICCKMKNRAFSETITTKVIFKDLDDEEIKWYIKTKEPFGKAGAYAIQGLGSRFVKSIKGSYSNVVGLPVCEVIDFLKKESVLDSGKEYKLD